MSRILIVDDNGDNLYLLHSLLEGYGHEVMEAVNGKGALLMARENTPDMIISDILMPVMDGFTLCREWTKDGTLGAIPLIFYTATYTDLKDKEFALSLGAQRYVLKPSPPEVFMGIINEVFAEKAAGKLIKPAEEIADESVVFRQYSEVLVHKLEDKMMELEEANKALEMELAERKRVEVKLAAAHADLERRVEERTAELNKLVNLMAGRETRMAELKGVIHQLRVQLEGAGIKPLANDPLG